MNEWLLLAETGLQKNGFGPRSEPGKAPLVLGDQDRGERAVTVAGALHAHRAMLGQHRLAAGAVALVGLALGLIPAGPIAQMQVHLRGPRALDHRLLERQEQLLNLAGRVLRWYPPDTGPKPVFSQAASAGTSGSGPRAAAWAAAVRLLFIGISMTFSPHDMPRTQNHG